MGQFKKGKQDTIVIGEGHSLMLGLKNRKGKLTRINPIDHKGISPKQFLNEKMVTLKKGKYYGTI